MSISYALRSASAMLVATMSLLFTNTAAAQCTGPMTVTILGSGTGQPLRIQGVNVVSPPTGCATTDGSLTLSISGGTSPYTYTISTNPTTPCGNPLSGYAGATVTSTATSVTFANLPQGRYFFCVTDANGCSSYSTDGGFSLPAPALQLSSIISVNAACGQSNGSATVYVTGNGSVPLVYSWSPTGQTTQTATGLAAATYQVTASAGPLCSVTGSVAVGNVGGPQVTGVVTNAICPASNGAIDLTVSGGTAPYSFNWSGTGTGNDPRTNLAAGNYSVTVSDAAGCQNVYSGVVGQSSNLAVNVSNQSNPTCGSSNGAVTLTPANGTAPYTLTFSNGLVGTGANGIFTGLTAGTYNVSALDASGCSTTFNFVLNGSGGVGSLAFVGSTNVSCNGGNNGTVNASVAGGSIQVRDAQGNTYPSNQLPAGSYTVIGLDGSGCPVGSQNFSISEPSPILAQVSYNPQSCNGVTPNSVSFNISGGTPAYSATWSDAFTGLVRNNFAVSNYTITVSDAQSCQYVFGLNAVLPTCAPPVIDNQCLVVNPGVTRIICAPYLSGNNNEVFNILRGPTTRTGVNLSSTLVPVNGLNTDNCFRYVAGRQNGFNATVRTDSMVIRACNPVIPTQCDTFWVKVFINDRPTAVLPGTRNGVDRAFEETRIVPPNYTLYLCHRVNNLDFVNCMGNLRDSIVVPTISGPHLPGATVGWAFSNAAPGGLIAPSQPPYLPSVFSPGNSCLIYNTPNVPGGRDTIVYQVCDPYGLCDTLRLNVNIYGFPNIVDVPGSNPGYHPVRDTARILVPPATASTNCLILSPASNNEIITIVDGAALPGASASLVTTPAADTCVTYNSPNLPGSSDTIIVTACNPVTPNLCDTSVIIYTISCPLNVSATTFAAAPSCVVGGSACINVPQATLTAYNAQILVDGFVYTGSLASCNAGAGTQIALPVGAHTLRINYGIGCSTTVAGTVTGPPSPVITAVTTTNTTICGVNNGTIRFTLAGAITAPVTITTNGDPLPVGAVVTVVGSGITVSNLGIGTYGPFRITDANLCFGTTNGTVDINAPTGPLLAATAFVNATTCVSPFDGRINVTLSRAGATPYTWRVNGTVVSASGSGTNWAITGLSPQTFVNAVISVTDNNGCSDNVVVNGQIAPPAAPAVAAVVVNNALCGGSNGTADVNMNPAPDNAYSYVWSPVAGTPNLDGDRRTNLPTGAYSITVTQTATGCTVTTSANVDAVGGPQVAQVALTAATCTAADGSAVINVSNGQPSYSITWTGNVTPQTLAANGNFTVTNVPYGNLNIVVTDLAGCQTTLPVTIPSSGGALQVALAQTVQPNCGGGSNGVITASLTGVGGGNVRLSLNPGNVVTTTSASSFAFSNLSAGSYTICATALNSGCQTCQTINLLENGAPAINLADFTITNATCPGANNTSVVENAPLSGRPYRLFSSAGVDLGLLPQSGIAPANGYYIGVIIAGCNASSVPFNITQPANFDIQFSTIDPTCQGNDGSVTITNISGGTPGYTFNWGGGITTAGRSNLSVGSYAVTVTDTRGCTASNAVTMNNGCQCDIVVGSTSVLNANCGINNGQATANFTDNSNTVVAPYTVSWSNNFVGGTATGLAAGSYTFTVSNGNGSCNATGSVAVSSANGPVVATTATDATCVASNGSVIVAATSGVAPFTFALGAQNFSAVALNATRTFTGLAAGAYVVSVTDNTGCLSTQNVNVGQTPGTLVVNPSVGTQPGCGLSNGSINVNVTGGATPYIYSINTTPVEIGRAHV